MRVAIAGAGVAGGYIFRLLRQRGHRHVDIFDITHGIACGIHPCGYGVDHNFHALARLVGLNPADYVLFASPRVVLDGGITAKTTVIMIDKPRFIKDLLADAVVRYEPLDVDRYDVVIDATGEARAYAPPLRHDLMARVLQWRVRIQQPATTTFSATRGIPGYAWIMPLSADGREVHVGAGCRIRTGPPARELTKRVLSSLKVERVVCACGARIRLSGPDFSRIVSGKIWAVGEAAGFVGPASGAGIVYAMQSGRHLVDHLGDPDGYLAALRRDFRHLLGEARALRKIQSGRLPTPLDLYSIYRGWARVGVFLSWRDMPRLMLTMKRAFAS